MLKSPIVMVAGGSGTARRSGLRRPAVARLLLLAAVLSTTGWAAAASASSPEREQARGKLKTGVKLLDAGHFDEALARFEDAYRDYPSARILYNIGLALKGLGRYAEAFTVFERFSREANEASAEHRRYSQQELERLARQVAFVQLSSDVAEAELLLDGQSLGKLAIPRRLPVDEGPHELVLRVPMRSISRQFTARAGDVLELKIDLVAGGSPASAPPAAEIAVARAAPPPSRPGPFSVGLEAGVRLPTYHGRPIERAALGTAGLRGSHGIPLGDFAADVSLTASFARLPYQAVGTEQRRTSALLGLLASAGISHALRTHLRLGAFAEAGVTWWSGLEEGDPFTLLHAGSTGPIPMPTVGLGAAVEYHLRGPLFLSARLSYQVSKTTSEGLTRSISMLSSAGAALGVGARL